MIDMKLTPDQSPAAMMGLMESGEHDGPLYPEGLVIELEGESLKRLAIGEGSLPAVGQKMMLHAMVEVVEVSKEDTQTRAEMCVELQIQQMELLPPDTPMNEQQAAYDRVSRVYG